MRLQDTLVPKNPLGASAEGGSAGPGRAGARVWLAPDEVEIGEPFTLGIEIEHELGTRIDVDASVFGPEAGWVLLGDDPRPGLPQHREGGLVTRVELALVALEQEPVPTDEGLLWSPIRSVPLPILTRVDAERSQELQLARPNLTVRGLLAVEEVEPRPFPEPYAPALEASTPVQPEWIVGAGLLLALGLGAALAVALRRRARRVAAAPPTLEARTRALAGRLSSGALERDAVFDVVHLVRDTIDARLERTCRSSTDDEWLAALPRDGEWPALRARLAEFLARATRVRFADSEPTEWAIEELLREGLEVAARLETLDLAPAGEAVGA